MPRVKLAVAFDTSKHISDAELRRWVGEALAANRGCYPPDDWPNEVDNILVYKPERIKA